MSSPINQAIGLPTDVAQAIQGRNLACKLPKDVILRLLKAASGSPWILSRTAPCNPQAGELYLVDSRACRTFRRDGHRAWLKPESHARVFQDGKAVATACYAHSSIECGEGRHLQRRIYRLMEQRDVVAVHYFIDVSHRLKLGQGEGDEGADGLFDLLSSERIGGGWPRPDALREAVRVEASGVFGGSRGDLIRADAGALFAPEAASHVGEPRGVCSADCSLQGMLPGPLQIKDLLPNLEGSGDAGWAWACTRPGLGDRSASRELPVAGVGARVGMSGGLDAKMCCFNCGGQGGALEPFQGGQASFRPHLGQEAQALEPPCLPGLLDRSRAQGDSASLFAGISQQHHHHHHCHHHHHSQMHSQPLEQGAHLAPLHPPAQPHLSPRHSSEGGYGPGLLASPNAPVGASPSQLLDAIAGSQHDHSHHHRLHNTLHHQQQLQQHHLDQLEQYLAISMPNLERSLGICIAQAFSHPDRTTPPPFATATSSSFAPADDDCAGVAALAALRQALDRRSPAGALQPPAVASPAPHLAPLHAGGRCPEGRRQRASSHSGGFGSVPSSARGDGLNGFWGPQSAGGLIQRAQSGFPSAAPETARGAPQPGSTGSVRLCGSKRDSGAAGWEDAAWASPSPPTTRRAGCLTFSDAFSVWSQPTQTATPAHSTSSVAPAAGSPEHAAPLAPAAGSPEHAAPLAPAAGSPEHAAPLAPAAGSPEHAAPLAPAAGSPEHAAPLAPAAGSPEHAAPLAPGISKVGSGNGTPAAMQLAAHAWGTGATAVDGYIASCGGEVFAPVQAF